MKQTIVAIFALFVLAGAANAQSFEKPKSHDTLFYTALATYGASAVADWSTSQGLNERNRILRNSDGRLSTPKMIGASLILPGFALWLKHLHHSKAAAVLLFIGAGGHGFGTGWNLRQ